MISIALSHRTPASQPSFVMNAMPWKGYILFTDFNSGLWAAKLEPQRP